MINVWKGVIGLLVVLSATSTPGVWVDPIWMFTDTGKIYYTNFRYCDTARNGDYLCFALESDQLPDTGVSLDGTKYINFNYQFTSDSLFIRDNFDPDVIHYRDKRPGYAGFKTAWDYGMTWYPISRYKKLVFSHLGPINPNHKVTVKCWYSDGSGGAISYCETLGTFTSSSTWKEETITIPDIVQNKPDKERNYNTYYELVFLITNLDPSDTTPGGPGLLKIDNMKLVGCNPIDTSPKPKNIITGQDAVFRVVAKPAHQTDNLTYQWMKNGTPIVGATSATYTIASAEFSHAGSYAVAVTVTASDNSSLTYLSQPATLTVSTLARLISAVASDGTIAKEGIDSDDYVLISFDSPLVTPPAITAGNIDSVFKLNNGHSWVSGFGMIDAQWNFQGNMLMVMLSNIVSVPTVAVGDTITWNNSKINISGSFNPVSVRPSKPLLSSRHSNKDVQVFSLQGKLVSLEKGNVRSGFRNVSKGVYITKGKNIAPKPMLVE